MNARNNEYINLKHVPFLKVCGAENIEFSLPTSHPQILKECCAHRSDGFKQAFTTETFFQYAIV